MSRDRERSGPLGYCNLVATVMILNLKTKEKSDNKNNMVKDRRLVYLGNY